MAFCNSAATIETAAEEVIRWERRSTTGTAGRRRSRGGKIEAEAGGETKVVSVKSELGPGWDGGKPERRRALG